MTMVPVRELRRVRWWLVTGLAGTVACGSGSDPLPTTASLDIVASTNGQSAPAGARLPQALAVTTRAGTGDVVPRAAVRWQVTEGSGAVLSDTATVADGNGRAEVVLTLGPGVGTYRVQASPTDAPSAAVVLTATATPAPQLASVTPSSFEAGDTLILDGSGLAAGAEVTVAGAPARVLGGSATSVTLIETAKVDAETSLMLLWNIGRSVTMIMVASGIAQADPDVRPEDLAARYPKAQVRDFDGDPTRVTEMDALVAYLQMLGTLVDVNSAAAQQELAQETGR